VSISRRGFLTATGTAGLGALAVGAGLGGVFDASKAAAVSTALPAPGSSGVEHVVVVMMENRSFDHFLGWLPGLTASSRV